MPRPEAVLPPVSSRAEYEALRIDANIWPLAMRIICQRHGLPTERLIRFGDGTDPTYGSNVVFAVGERYIIKLYPPFDRRLFEADRTVAEHVYGKLEVTTPEIYAYGTLENWPYLVMSRLQGVYLSDVWDTLEYADQLRLVTELAGLLVHLHALPTDKLTLLEGNWSAFVAERVRNCVQLHREQEVPASWLQQIPGYLAYAAPLYPPGFTPAIVSADIHEYHLLARQEHGQWQLSGLFDFDDARIGFHEYDLASAGLFMMWGRPALLRTFLLTYGYPEAEINEQLSHRLMAYTLLHRYRPLNWVREAFVKQPCSTLEELAKAIYAL